MHLSSRSNEMMRTMTKTGTIAGMGLGSLPVDEIAKRSQRISMQEMQAASAAAFAVRTIECVIAQTSPALRSEAHCEAIAAPNRCVPWSA